MQTLFHPTRLMKLLQRVKTEEDFIKEAMRFWHWYMVPEVRAWTKTHLARFYHEYKTN